MPGKARTHVCAYRPVFAGEAQRESGSAIEIPAPRRDPASAKGAGGGFAGAQPAGA